MAEKNFSIAIDGPAGAGKSTIAKALATELGVMYLDTGAMYRAFGLAMLRKRIVNDTAAVVAEMDNVDIAVEYRNGIQHILLDGEDVSTAIREPEVSKTASNVSSIPEVRERMVALQRKIAEGHSVIMDGRDIGTHVLPNATLKIYLTASAEERARRRCQEQEQKGISESYDQVLREMVKRDYQDIHRVTSPLRPAVDAVPLDTSYLTLEESVAIMKKLVLEAIGQ